MKISTLYFLFLALLASCGGNPARQADDRHPDSVNYARQPLPQTPVNSDTSYIEYVFQNYDLVNIHSLDTSISIDLKYAGTGNFLKKNLYDGLRNAYLNCETAIKLCNAQFFLKQKNPDYTLVIFDAARPLHIQQIMWDSTTLDSSTRYSYLAPPLQTSLHNYGCAVDLSIKNLKTNTLLDMGSGYDHFGKISQPAYEWYFLKDSTLSRQAYENRKLLREVMRRAHFRSIPSEWWHFSICSKEEAVLKFKLIK